MLAGMAIAAVTAASAQAARVTVGSSLAGPFESATSFGLATRANLTLPPPANAASPVDGTAISWSFIGAEMTPRIIRPVGGGLFTGAGTGPKQAGAGPGAISGPFPINLPIKAGDLFGVNTDGASSPFGTRDAPGAARGLWNPLADGGPGDDPTVATGQELAVQAVVRYCLVPKLKGKKPGKAKQALRAADCTVGAVRKGRKARKKRVVKQSVPPGSSISDTTPVDLKVSRKKK
jgi:PASTA domain-containing protein